MLSNHTITDLEERISYFTVALNDYLAKKEMIQKDLEEVQAMLVEAEARDIIGNDMRDGARVYLDGKIIWVEGKPSGWMVENFYIRVGGTIKVTYDGRTNWTGELKFSENR